jgi:hypothetical protein
MAHDPETSASIVNGPERVLKLITDFPGTGRDVAWLADRFVELASEYPSLRIEELPPDERGASSGPETEIADSTSTVRTTDVAVRRLLRPLLARLAVMAHEEAGAAFTPYGGQAVLTREPFHLLIEFSNTTTRRLQVTRAARAYPGNGVPHPTSAEPATG